MMRSVIISKYHVSLRILIMVPVPKFYGDVVDYPDVLKKMKARSVNEDNDSSNEPLVKCNLEFLELRDGYDVIIRGY
jgi:hypothetical protein